MEHELRPEVAEQLLGRLRVGDVEPLPLAAGVRVARRARREVGRDHLVTLRDERADQVVADLSAGAGDEDLHAARICHQSRLGAQRRASVATSHGVE